ncbi:hypothetical protein FD21_GL000259 [Liquorilactobacillus vini DSM 20605]|uniref:Uncharacterized protein n=1 Tax=Liquorilactobacillus vini DSM 20605 TaxID=1133569 RepID=A0A0R2CKZ5_9LACO|nr:hypothetical protein FD21_GL000259 [Liquorilactobacillus vini DSM 20605]
MIITWVNFLFKKSSLLADIGEMQNQYQFFYILKDLKFKHLNPTDLGLNTSLKLKYAYEVT